MIAKFYTTKVILKNTFKNLFSDWPDLEWEEKIYIYI